MRQINKELLSIDEIKRIDESVYVYGYYDDKFFVLAIANNDLTLGYDDTECTDEEIKAIFDYVMNSGMLNIH